jgi:GDSL-like Lipase/Acylhydrolase family
MKRWTGLGFLAALLCLSACRLAAPAPQPSSLASPTATLRDTPLIRHYPRILFVGGDLSTLSTGSETSDYFQSQVVAQLQAQDQRSATESYSLAAQPGIHAVDAMSGLTVVPASDLVIVDLGTNDFGLSNGHPSSLSAFDASYQHLLQAVLAPSPHAQLVCLTLWTDPMNTNALLLPADAYNSVISNACQQASGNNRVLDVARTLSEVLSQTTTSPSGGPVAGNGSAYQANQDNDYIIARALVRSLEMPAPQQ